MAKVYVLLTLKQKAFEADFCNLYRKRAEKRGFAREFLAKCAREIQQENEIERF